MKYEEPHIEVIGIKQLENIITESTLVDDNSGGREDIGGWGS